MAALLEGMIRRVKADWPEVKALVSLAAPGGDAASVCFLLQKPQSATTNLLRRFGGTSRLCGQLCLAQPAASECLPPACC